MVAMQIVCFQGVPNLFGDGEGICGGSGFQEHLMCHSNLGIENFSFKLQTKLALVR